MRTLLVTAVAALAFVGLASPTRADNRPIVACATSNAVGFTGKIKPRTCNTYFGGRAHADVVGNITNLRWSSWGGRVATARGVVHWGGEVPPYKATIKLSGRVTCEEDGMRIYTKLTAYSPALRGGHTSQFMRSCG